jgi:hypothetical protein
MKRFSAGSLAEFQISTFGHKIYHVDFMKFLPKVMAETVA